jgi:hypothetical protein
MAHSSLAGAAYAQRQAAVNHTRTTCGVNIFYAGWIVPWVEEEPPRGSRLGRLSQVLFGKLHQQLQADAADLQVTRLDLPDTRSDLADSASVEWLRHELLVRAVAVGDLCLRLADTILRIVSV